MSSSRQRIFFAFAAALAISSCGSTESSSAGEALPPATDAAAPQARTAEHAVESVPAASAELSAVEDVLLVRQTTGETSRMLTVRADGSGEQEFVLPAPCVPDDRGCAVRMVLPSVNGRSLVVALEHLYWYHVRTGELTHIARIDDVRVDDRGKRRFAVAETSTEEGSMLMVVDREMGTILETPFDASAQIVGELANGVFVRDQRGPTVIVNTLSGTTSTIDDSLLVGPDQISDSGEVIAAFDLSSDNSQVVMIDADDPSSALSWPPIELDFVFDWAGEKLMTVSTEHGVVQLVDELGAVELARLWPGDHRVASVVVDPDNEYAIVNVMHPEETLWYRVDIGAAVATELVDLRGMEPSDIDVHADRGFVWATDAADEDRNYTRLVAIPIAPGSIVEVSATEMPTSAAVWPLNDDHVFVRSYPNESVLETLWIVDLGSERKEVVASGSEPRFTTSQTTMAVTARSASGSWVVVMPMDDPSAATTLVKGSAIDWIERSP